MPAKKRDYKAEYKKFQSSTKAKKYRAELNKYNRKKGTYGNGDGKDASHKGGKIVGFEAQSKNRGRAEKSRLKKEAKLNENPAAIAAAQSAVIQAKTGKKVSVNTARQPSYAKKDPSAHNKAKGIWQRIKDKFSKKEMLEATYGQMLAKKGKKLNVIFVNGKPKIQIVDLEPVEENTEKAVKDMISRKVVKKGQSNKDRVRAIGQWLDDHSHEVSAKYNDVWIRRIKMGRGGQVQDWWGDTMTMIKNRLGESVNEAVSPKGWNMSKKYISFIDREVKKLKKYHMQQNEEDFLEVANYIELQLKQMKKDLNESVNEAINHPKVQKQANQLAKVLKDVVAAAKKDDRKLARKLVGSIYDIYNDLDWTIQRDLRYKESVNERTDSQAKKNLMRALKNSKVANVFSYDNDQIAIEMTNGDDYIVGNIQSYNPNESINEANIKDIEKVLKTRSAKKIDGMYMDMTTANAIMTVWKALNTSNRKKFEKLPLKKMVDVTWKLVK